MDKVITPPQLNEFLHDVIEKTPVYRHAAHDCFELVLWTGCRAMEAINLKRWQLKDNNVVLLATMKKNNPRNFTEDELPKSFFYWYRNQDKYASEINYRKVQYVFEELTNKNGFIAGKKGTLLHLFRYNYIKWLKYNGMDDEAIQYRVGHTNIESTRYYIDMNITYKSLTV